MLKPAGTLDRLLRPFARAADVVLVPLAQRPRSELLDIVKNSQARLQNAGLISIPPVMRNRALMNVLCACMLMVRLQVCWDGSEGEEEEQAISTLGLLIVP